MPRDSVPHVTTNGVVGAAPTDRNDIVRVENASSGTTHAGIGNDEMHVANSRNVTVTSGPEAAGRGVRDNDTIELYNSSGNFRTGAGNDRVYTSGQVNGTVHTGSGNDTVSFGNGQYRDREARNSNLSIDGGAGTDTFVTNERVTGVARTRDASGTTLTFENGARVTLRGFENVNYNGENHGSSAPSSTPSEGRGANRGGRGE